MNVGYKLYREVRDFAPADWTPSELVIALMIADDASDTTRKSWIPGPLLCQRVRLAPVSVRQALARLSRRGFEFRVCHGYGKDGRPVFAAKGHAVDYLVPDMVKGAALASPFPVDNPAERRWSAITITDPKAMASHPKAMAKPLKGDGVPSPLSSISSISTSTKEADVTYSNVEGSQLAAEIRTPIESNGHLPIELAALRAALARRQHQETR